MHATALAALAALVIGLFAQLGPGQVGPEKGRRSPPLGEVTIAEPVVKSASGQVDRTIVTRYLRRDRAKYHHCYERALATSPRVRGVLTLAFRVLPDGRVTSVRAEGISNQIENCVARFARGLRLPELPEAANVRVRMIMKPATS